MTPKEVLALPMRGNDIDAKTVGDYLRALLKTLWREGEGFSGKRPFGNSGWDFAIKEALIRGGAVQGSLDDDGFVVTVDDAAVDQIIIAAIDSLA